MVSITVTVDDVRRTVVTEPRTLLVHLLREELGKMGTVVGCDTSNCGACTVLLDCVSVKSSAVLAVQADGASVDTVEGLAGADGTLHPVQQAFHEHHGLQCGYCTPGMLMRAVCLVQENPSPTEEEVREGLEGNMCRCTGYQGIVDAVLAYAESDGERAATGESDPGAVADQGGTSAAPASAGAAPAGAATSTAQAGAGTATGGQPSGAAVEELQ